MGHRLARSLLGAALELDPVFGILSRFSSPRKSPASFALPSRRAFPDWPILESMSCALKEELKQLIVETINLEDVNPSDIGDDEHLFGSGLDLDSIDALELVLQLEKRYGVKIKSSEASREALRSINTLAEFIETARTEGT